MLGTVNFGEVRKRRNKKEIIIRSIYSESSLSVCCAMLLLLFFVVLFFCFIVTYSSDKLVCPWCGQSVFVQFYLIIYIYIFFGCAWNSISTTVIIMKSNCKGDKNTFFFVFPIFLFFKRLGLLWWLNFLRIHQFIQLQSSFIIRTFLHFRFSF